MTRLVQTTAWSASLGTSIGIAVVIWRVWGGGVPWLLLLLAALVLALYLAVLLAVLLRLLRAERAAITALLADAERAWAGVAAYERQAHEAEQAATAALALFEARHGAAALHLLQHEARRLN